MSVNFEDFSSEESTNEELSTETTETTEVNAESTTSEPEQTIEDGGAENTPIEDVFAPNYEYEIKGEKHEIPEFLRESIKNQEHQSELIDYLTRANALDGIKGQRDELKTYRENLETNFIPRIQEFDQAVAVGDFSTAFNLGSINPEGVMDFMMNDEQLSQKLYQRVLERVNAEEQGPQAVEAQKNSYLAGQQQRQLQFENQNLSRRLETLEASLNQQALNASIMQNQEMIGNYDSLHGNGSFNNFVSTLTEMNKMKGVQVEPSQVVTQAISMLGLGNVQAVNTAQANTAQTQQVQQTQQTTTTPTQNQVIPNLGSGSGKSVIGQPAKTMDDWVAQMNRAV